MIKLIIFDFDGVIIGGSNEGYFRCYHKALETVGISFGHCEEREKILVKWGTGYKAQLTYILKEHDDLIPAAIKSYEYYYNETDLFTQDIKLISGAKKSLEKLSNSYKLAIATGMMRKTLDKFLKNFNLKMFNLILSIDEVNKEEDKKPSPFMLNKIIKILKVNANETVYIGDGETDVIMARNANVIPIIVLSGHLTKEEAKKLGVQHIIENITFIEKKLEQVS